MSRGRVKFLPGDPQPTAVTMVEIVPICKRPSRGRRTRGRPLFKRRGVFESRRQGHSLQPRPEPAMRAEVVAAGAQGGSGATTSRRCPWLRDIPLLGRGNAGAFLATGSHRCPGLSQRVRFHRHASHHVRGSMRQFPNRCCGSPGSVEYTAKSRRRRGALLNVAWSSLWAYQRVRRSTPRRSLDDITLRVLVELLLTAGRAEVVGSALILALPSGLLLVNLHATDRVLCHDEFPSFG